MLKFSFQLLHCYTSTWGHSIKFHGSRTFIFYRFYVLQISSDAASDSGAPEAEGNRGGRGRARGRGRGRGRARGGRGRGRGRGQTDQVEQVTAVQRTPARGRPSGRLPRANAQRIARLREDRQQRLRVKSFISFIILTFNFLVI